MSTVSEITGASGGRRRRRRADADRSVSAILDAATKILNQNPQASMGEIASAAGLTRQTVYAHFSSRDAIVNALTERATARVTAALKAADLSRGRAAEALLRLVQVSWETFETEALLLNYPSPASDPEDERQQHLPVLEMLHGLVERGQREGDFDLSLPTNWIVAATVALGHAAGDEVRAGRMTSSQAGAVVQRALHRLFAE